VQKWRKKNRLKCQKFHVENFADITALMVVSIGIPMIKTAMAGSIVATMEHTTTPVNAKAVCLTRGKT